MIYDPTNQNHWEAVSTVTDRIILSGETDELIQAVLQGREAIAYLVTRAEVPEHMRAGLREFLKVSDSLARRVDAEIIQNAEVA